MPTRLPEQLVGAPIAAREAWLLQHLHAASTSDYIGESVSQLDHALQCATLAEQHGDPELTLAALLHDIGHLVPSQEPSMEGLGTRNHERVGADILLGLGFSARVGRLVAGHVNAKRFLASQRPAYLAKLSPASTRTLALQGGPMTTHEQAEFEQHSDARDLIQLRGFDEGAKALGANFRPLEHFTPLLAEHLASQSADSALASLATPFTQEQLDEWRTNQVLVLPGILKDTALADVDRWTSDLARRFETPGRWMKYYERTAENERQLCRIEDFVSYHAGMDALIRGTSMLDRVSELMGERAVLFKEKINFKLAGGSGFAAHQDAPAFDAFGQQYHITVLITVDPSNRSNGGLEFAEPTGTDSVLKQAADGTIAEAVATNLTWRPIDLPAGSVVLFDSYIAHRSPRNTSDGSRRSLYITYSRAAEGDVRDRYYADKRNTFPPEIEREPGIDYAKKAGRYNLANPIL